MFGHSIAHIVMTEQPNTQNIDPSIEQHIEAFFFNLHFTDDTLKSYGVWTNHQGYHAHIPS
jgi:hypothetical protein